MLKKTIVLILSIILCVACVSIMVACNSNKKTSGDTSHIAPSTDEPGTDDPITEEPDTDTSDTDEPSIDDLSVIIEGFSFDNENGYISVPNSQEVFTFNELVKVNPDSTWELSLDIYDLLPITTNTIQLSVGDNYVYLLVTSEISESSRLYTLNVRRHPVYTITFDTFGGTIIENKYVEENQLCPTPNAPQKEGYSFIGWDYDLSCPITDNIEVNAEWEANTYKVYYNYEGGSYSDNRTYDEVTFDSEYQLIIPTRQGYTFLGWFANNGEDEVCISDEKGVSLSPYSKTDSITVYAKWDFNYIYSETDIDIIIIEYIGAEKEVIVPDFINEKPVTEIADYAFEENDYIEIVALQNNLTFIGEFAFNGCSNLTEIFLGKSVRNIRYCAFYNCVNLDKVYYNNYFENWFNLSFSNEYSNPIYYSENLYVLDDYGNYMSAIGGYVSVTKVNNYAFINCKTLEEVYFHNKVTVGIYAFSGCDNLTIHYLAEH